MSTRLVIVAVLLLGATALADEPPLSKPPADVLLPPGAIRRFGEVRFRHFGGNLASALAPDGKLLATASMRSVILWDVSTGAAVRRFDIGVEHPTIYQSLSFSPDGRKLAVCTGADSDVFVWDVAGGNEITHIANSRDGIVGFEGLATFTSDGRQLAVSRGLATDFHDTETWKVVRSARVPGRLISPVGPTVVGRYKNGHVVLTNPAKDLLPKTLNLETHSSGLALSPNGRTLAAFSVMGRLELWSMPDGELLKSADILGNARSGYISFAPDGKELFLATPDGITRRDAVTLEVIGKLSAGPGVTGLHLLPDGDTVLICSNDGLIRRASRKSGDALPNISAGYEGPIAATATRDGRLLAIGDRSGRIDLWDTKTGKSNSTVAEHRTASKLAFSSDGTVLAVAHRNEVEQRDVKNQGIIASKSATSKERAGGSTPSVRHLEFGPNGQVLWTMNRGLPCTLWDTATNAVRPFGSSKATVAAGLATFSPDGKSILFTTLDQGLAYFDIESGGEYRPINPRTGMKYPATALAFSADGRRLAVATDDGLFHLCDPANGQELAVFPLPGASGTPGARRTVRASMGTRVMQFSPDGNLLLTGEMDGAVRVWDVPARQEAHRFAGHERQVTFVAFGPNGRTILSAGDDGAVYEWNPRPRNGRPTRSRWDDLIDDAAIAYRAGWELSDDPVETMKTIRANLRPAAPPPPEELSRLIGQLNSDRFAAREAASRALADMLPLSTPALRSAAAGELAPEARERVTKLLATKSDELTPTGLRSIRAVQILERIGSPEAIALLGEFAAGADGAPLTEEARHALARLGKR